ncbi:MAG: FtsX-like permease family protein [Myxococcales bacterium]|nr:FtsX-like permease family protein [Myxococcales bacterium]
MKTALSRWLSLIAFSLGSLGRRRGRSIATVVGLALVAMAFASVFALTDALRGEARRTVTTMPDITVSRMRAGRPATIAAFEAEQLRGVAGVGSIRPRVWGYLYLDVLSTNVVVVGLAPHQRRAVAAALVEGAVPTDAQRGWVVLGDAVGRAFGARVGDELELGRRAFRVAAIARPLTSVVTADVVAMDERDARGLLSLEEGEATDLAIHVFNPNEIGTAAARVAERMPGARVATREELSRVYELTYGARGGFVALSLLPALLALLVLAWDRLTGLSTDERREIAALKVVGWSTRDVLIVRAMEAALVAFAATVLGAIAAHVYVFVLGAPGLASALRGWSVLAPTIPLTPSGDGASVLSVVALTVVPWLAASVVPAWRAAVIEPAEGLR